VYIDRTQTIGGVPTPCIEVDLNKLSIQESDKITVLAWNVGDYCLAYEVDGVPHGPNTMKLINGGSFGQVYSLEYALGTRRTASMLTVLLKTQPYDHGHDALKAMQVAVRLRDCNLVHFKYFVIHPPGEYLPTELWTAMEPLSKDCSEMWTSEKRPLTVKFVVFLERTLECLRTSNASFADMKLKNCGVNYCDTGAEFRILDVDSLNNHIYTYPAVQAFKQNMTDRELWLQTRYAFGITAYMWAIEIFYPKDMLDRFGSKSKTHFIHHTMGSVEERLTMLNHALLMSKFKTSRDNTDARKIYAFIQEHAVNVLNLEAIKNHS
jgi:hypothetical protein